jgi:aminotransferase
MLSILRSAGFEPFEPSGAYYVMCDTGALGFENDVKLARYLVEEVGVAAVPGSSFFSNPESGRNLIRFCFAKKPETLDAAEERLKKIR